MNLPVILLEPARVEFDEAANWYEQRKDGLGTEFTSAVRNVVNGVAVQPDKWPVVYLNVREAPISGYPYAIYYRVEKRRIVVLSVFHASRDPDVWQSRA